MVVTLVTGPDRAHCPTPAACKQAVLNLTRMKRRNHRTTTTTLEAETVDSFVFSNVLLEGGKLETNNLFH